MRFDTVAEYKKEIARVQAASDSSCSEFIRQDHGTYMKKLMTEVGRFST